MPADSSAAPWQNTALALEINSPLREPSAEVLAKPPVWLPSSSFIPDYSDASGAGPTKVIMERGEPRLVTALPQGFSGSGFERYPSGETCVPAVQCVLSVQHWNDCVHGVRHALDAGMSATSAMVAAMGEARILISRVLWFLTLKAGCRGERG